MHGARVYVRAACVGACDVRVGPCCARVGAGFCIAGHTYMRALRASRCVVMRVGACGERVRARCMFFACVVHVCMCVLRACRGCCLRVWA